MKMAFGKKDIVVVLGCAVFVLANLGAVGSSGRRRAKEAVCLSNLHKWGVAWKMFLEDNKGRLTIEGLSWLGPLWPYHKDEKLLICPSAAKPQFALKDGDDQLGGKFNAWAYWWYWDYIDWEEVPPPGKHYVGGYGLNQWFSQETGGRREDAQLWGYAPGSLLAAKGANQVPMLLDCRGGGSTPFPEDVPPEYEGQPYFSQPINYNEIRNFCFNRHHGAVNGVFLDFSARKIGLKELWLLRWHRTWYEDLEAAGGLPVEFNDPNHWMYNFKDYSIY